MCGRLRHGFGHIYTYELRPQRTSRVQEKHVCPIVIWCFESQNIVRTSTKRLFDSTNVTVVSPLRNYFAVHKEIARVSKILVSVSLQSLLRVDLLASLLREQYSTTNTSSSPMSIFYNFTEVQRMHSRPSFRLQPLQPVSSHSPWAYRWLHRLSLCGDRRCASLLHEYLSLVSWWMYRKPFYDRQALAA